MQKAYFWSVRSVVVYERWRVREVVAHEGSTVIVQCWIFLFLTVPSQPVGPEANYINSSALLVKWQPPLYPNGKITKYIVKYDLSDYSPWKQDLNWCNRQILTGAESNVDDEEDGDKNLNGKTSWRMGHLHYDVFLLLRPEFISFSFHM